MRRLSVVIAVVALAAAGLTAVAATAFSTQRTRPVPGDPVGPAFVAAPPPLLTRDVLVARLATARYATGLAAARSAGYRIITRMIPEMGYHFMNPHVSAFQVTRPPILVYEHRGRQWQLGALEWVFTSMPRTPPLPGARYGVFGAACHYVDGTFVFAASSSRCSAHSPQTRAPFAFWHPRLITLHFWVWYPNPAGIYMGTNPLVVPFDGG